MSDTVKIINENLGEMTKSECKTAGFYMQNPKDFAFDTLDVISSKIGISTTSVIRFCRRLGFEGFKDFQESVRSELKYRPSLPDKLERAVKAGIDDELLSRTLTESVNCIEESFSAIPRKSIARAAALISEARSVYTFGMRESFALAHYAYTRLLSVRHSVSILDMGGAGQTEALLGLEKEDVCVAFLFHRYTKNALDILKVLKKRGVPVILVTAPPFDKIVDCASMLLPCYTDIGGIKNSFAAPVCLCDYLCSAVASKMSEEALEYMKASEGLFEELDILTD